MDRSPQGWDNVSQDPLPFVRGLYQLSPERRLSAILSRTARSSERRRCLPADSVIWLVIAMALFAADSIPKVWRRLHPTRDHPEPTDSAFSQARRRLGVAPLRHLFLETAGPMATHQTIGASYRGWRLMGLDGTMLDLPDTPDNARTFGRPTTGRAEGAFPPGPAVGPLRAGHARRLQPGDQAAVPRRAIDGRSAAGTPRARHAVDLGPRVLQLRTDLCGRPAGRPPAGTGQEQHRVAADPPTGRRLVPGQALPGRGRPPPRHARPVGSGH